MQFSGDRVQLSVEEARALARQALGRLGYDLEEASIVAEHTLDAALCGYEYSGLPKILNVAEHPQLRKPRRHMRAVRETDVSVMYDGGNNVGMVTMYHAAQAAIAKAQAHGFSIVGVNNSWVSGRGAHYVEMIARADLGVAVAGSQHAASKAALDTARALGVVAHVRIIGHADRASVELAVFVNGVSAHALEYPRHIPHVEDGGPPDDGAAMGPHHQCDDQPRLDAACGLRTLRCVESRSRIAHGGHGSGARTNRRDCECADARWPHQYRRESAAHHSTARRCFSRRSCCHPWHGLSPTKPRL